MCRGFTQSRRNDSESLADVMCYLLRGDLPWHDYDYIEQELKAIPEELFNCCLDEFVDYLTHVRRLAFDEKPDYESLRKIFRDLFDRHFLNDYVFD